MKDLLEAITVFAVGAGVILGYFALVLAVTFGPVALLVYGAIKVAHIITGN